MLKEYLLRLGPRRRDELYGMVRQVAHPPTTITMTVTVAITAAAAAAAASSTAVKVRRPPRHQVGAHNDEQRDEAGRPHVELQHQQAN